MTRRIALKLLTMVTTPPDREFVIGDLMEEYRLRGGDGRWLQAQVLRSIGPMLAARIRKERWLRNTLSFMGIILASYAALAVPIIIVQAFAHGFWIDLIMMGVAAIISTQLYRRRGMHYVWGFTIFVLLMWVLSFSTMGEPWWYRIFLGAGVSCSILAGGFFQRYRSHS